MDLYFIYERTKLVEKHVGEVAGLWREAYFIDKNRDIQIITLNNIDTLNMY